MNSTALNITDHENGIVQITLSKPDIHNAFDEMLIAELTSTLTALDCDQSTKVVILDACGKSFSAGADLNWMKKMSEYSREENYQDSVRLSRLMATLYEMKCPTIAAVQGAAFGGGVGLIACCDIAIATTNAKFSLSEVKLGLVPAVISPYVVKAIGERAAKRYFVTGEIFHVQKAEQLGLISETVNSSELNAAVKSIAESIIKNGPEAVLSAKKIINDVAQKPINEQLCDMTAERIADIRVSTQGKEGIAAFLEKRKAKWDQE